MRSIARFLLAPAVGIWYARHTADSLVIVAASVVLFLLVVGAVEHVLDHDDAIRVLIARILVSPAFLYRVETVASGAGWARRRASVIMNAGKSYIRRQA